MEERVRPGQSLVRLRSPGTLKCSARPIQLSTHSPLVRQVAACVRRSILPHSSQQRSLLAPASAHALGESDLLTAKEARASRGRARRRASALCLTFVSSSPCRSTSSSSASTWTRGEGRGRGPTVGVRASASASGQACLRGFRDARARTRRFHRLTVSARAAPATGQCACRGKARALGRLAERPQRVSTLSALLSFSRARVRTSSASELLTSSRTRSTGSKRGERLRQSAAVLPSVDDGQGKQDQLARVGIVAHLVPPAVLVGEPNKRASCGFRERA